MSTIVWHNPRCTKSRQTVALLEEKGIDFDVRLYLDDVPSVAELKKAAQALGLDAQGWARKKEADYKEINGKTLSDDELFAAMSERPKLIERPVVFHGGKAAIGRPPEDVLKLF